MTLKNKIVIVTGGSGLIGKEILNDIITKGGIPINFDLQFNDDFVNNIYVDLNDHLKVEKAVQDVVTKFGKIDGLVNNAFPRTKDWSTKFEDIKIDSWRANIDMQLNGYYIITQYVLKYMKAQNYGSIVSLGSIYGVVGNDFTIYDNTDMHPAAAYSAIKGGIINLTKYLASYYGKNNIRINCVSPGGIFDKQHESFVRKYEDRVPLKRMGNPNDIAPPISFLISDEAKYITGHNLIVDGGWTVI